MERQKLEELISAYLDGELDSKQETEFLEEVKKYPDLMTEIEQLKKLDTLSTSRKVDLPADGYFDNLAERIDAQIQREALPEKRSLISTILRPSYKLISIIGSAAAVILIAVVALEIYQPAEDVYHKAVPTSEMSKDVPTMIETEDSVVETSDDALTVKAVPDEQVTDGILETSGSFKERIKQQVGEVENFDDLQIRGGRSNEQTYIVDSVKKLKPTGEEVKEELPKEKIEKKKEVDADLSTPVTKDVERPKYEPQAVTLSVPFSIAPKKVADSIKQGEKESTEEKVKKQVTNLSESAIEAVEIPKDEPQVKPKRALQSLASKRRKSAKKEDKDTINIKDVMVTAEKKLKVEKLADSQVISNDKNSIELDEVISGGFSAEYGFSLSMYIEESEKIYRKALMEKKKEILNSAISRLDSCMRMDSISHRKLWQARKDTLTTILDSINTSSK